MAVLAEIRILVAADDMEHADLLLGALGDTLTALVGEDRYGAVLFEGINPNGTDVPEGFEPILPDTSAIEFTDTRAEADEVEGRAIAEYDEIEGAAI
jgi:hypothetical protein